MSQETAVFPLQILRLNPNPASDCSIVLCVACVPDPLQLYLKNFQQCLKELIGLPFKYIMGNKTLTLAALFIAFTFPCLSQGSSAVDWGEDRLKAADFMVVSGRTDEGADAYTAARVSYMFRVYSNGSTRQVEIIIKNIFKKDESWMKQQYLEDERLLQHEQLHFDLGELYARKLVKAFTESKASGNNLKEELDAIFKSTLSEMAEEQKKYDAETKHGQVVLKQKEWEARTQEELRLLAPYAKKHLTYSIN